MRISVLVAVLACFARPVCASPLTEKLCVLNAAPMLPAIPGLVISGASLKDAAPGEVVSTIMGTLGSTEQAARALDGRLLYLDGRLEQAARYPYTNNGKEIFTQAVVAAVNEAHTVVIAVKAAGLDAKYGYVCAVGKTGGNYVVPTGLIE